MICRHTRCRVPASAWQLTMPRSAHFINSEHVSFRPPLVSCESSVPLLTFPLLCPLYFRTQTTSSKFNQSQHHFFMRNIRPEEVVTIHQPTESSPRPET